MERARGRAFWHIRGRRPFRLLVSLSLCSLLLACERLPEDEQWQQQRAEFEILQKRYPRLAPAIEAKIQEATLLRQKARKAKTDREVRAGLRKANEVFGSPLLDSVRATDTALVSIESRLQLVRALKIEDHTLKVQVDRECRLAEQAAGEARQALLAIGGAQQSPEQLQAELLAIRKKAVEADSALERWSKTARARSASGVLSD